MVDLLHPLGLYVLALGVGFLIPLLYRSSPAGATGLFLAALSGMVLIAGVSLIGTVALGSVIAYLEHLVQDSYPMVNTWLNLADRSLSLLLMPFVLALIFWFFPATKITWRDVWPAGLLTALLIAASRYLIHFYLRVSSTSEVYGAAGSLVVLLIWIYITGLVVFFGASFSCAWAETFGSRSKLNSELDDSADLEAAPLSHAENGSATTIDGPPPSKVTPIPEGSSPPIELQRRMPDS